MIEEKREADRERDREISHGWVDLEAAAATTMRSVMGGGDEIVSRRSDPNHGCMHDNRAMG